MSKNWEDGLRIGQYHNPGTRKKKKRKLPPRPRGRRAGIHKKRMMKRREG